MVNYTSISNEATEAIVAQGGQVLASGIMFPDATESNVLASDIADNNFDEGQFVLPDGLVVFVNDGKVSL